MSKNKTYIGTPESGDEYFYDIYQRNVSLWDVCKEKQLSADQFETDIFSPRKDRDWLWYVYNNDCPKCTRRLFKLLGGNCTAFDKMKEK